MAKTQIRSTLESQNAQREKKIAQLNEFIARFAAGTRSSQVTSRRKEVERLQTNELARSNIQRPYIRFDQVRPSGKHVLEFKHLTKLYGDHEGDRRLYRQCAARRKDLPDGPQRRRQDDAAEEPARQLSGPRGPGFHARLGSGFLGPRGADRLLPAGRGLDHRARTDRRRVAASLEPRGARGRDSRHSWADALFAAKKAKSRPRRSPAASRRGWFSAS